MLNENLKLLFIIPARFGSKGIPRKNLKILNGKPLIFYSINNASEISCEKEVVVSSDSDEILHCHKVWCKSLKRPAELAGDQTTLDPVVFHAYKSLSVDLNFDYVVILQPTSPLLSAKSLESALMLFLKIKKLIHNCKEERFKLQYENGEYIPNYKEGRIDNI